MCGTRSLGGHKVLVGCSMATHRQGLAPTGLRSFREALDMFVDWEKPSAEDQNDKIANKPFICRNKV